MELDGASHAALAEFWACCGPPGLFPRTLERALALGLPIFLVKVPRLSLGAMRDWLAARGRVAETSLFAGPERGLHGAVIASAGQGVIFLDGADPEDEQRFSLAHEVAHFLLDYWLPRRAALAKLGPALAEVLDGRRVPTPEERLGALLLHAPLQTYADLLSRDENGVARLVDLDHVEARADRLALALLAPADAVWQHAGDLDAARFAARHSRLTETLTGRFGLPHPIAGPYAHLLLREIGKGPSWAERLRD